MNSNLAYLESLNNDNKKLLNIIHSLNPTLSYKLALNTKDVISTIVDPDGNGTYTTIEAAAASGATYIFIKAGAYNLTEDLTLTNQYLIGENQKEVIINLTNCSIFLLGFDCGMSRVTEYTTLLTIQ